MIRAFFARHPWWAVLPLLVLALVLASPRLDSEGLWYDEMWSVYVAGGAHLGPLMPEGILQRVLWEDSTQGYGYPLLLGAWGGLAGWSEYSIRVLALFGGLLAIAMAYRLGHDVFPYPSPPAPLPQGARGAAHPSSPNAAWVGLLAAMILSTSAFFIWYLHEGRVYSIVVLLSLTTVWSYLRLLRVTRASGPLMALFVFSAAGLLYANYFAVVLLVGIAAYHLLINPYVGVNKANPTPDLSPLRKADPTPDPSPLRREGRAKRARRIWWRLVFLAVCAVIVCLPTLYGIRGGYAMYAGWDDVRNRALSLPALAQVFAHFLSHDAMLLLAILLGVGIVGLWRQGGSARALLIITACSLLVVFLIQWRTNIIEFTKFRYVIGLWGLLAVWIAAGMVSVGTLLASFIAGRSMLRPYRTVIPTGIIGLVALIWFVGGVNANLDPYFMTENGPTGDLPRWRTVINVLKRDALPQDVYAHYSGPRARDDDMSFWFTMHEIRIPSFITISAFDVENEDWAWAQVERAWRVWYSQDLRQPRTNDHTRFVQRMTDMGYTACAVPYEDAVMRLDLYVDAPAFCPGGAAVVRFGDGVTLTGWPALPAALTADERLVVPMGWTIAPAVPAENYSIGVYLMADASTVAAQADTGLPQTPFGLAQVEVPLTGVPSGTYGVYLAVYEWNGPNALPATHVQTGETSPRLIRMGTVQVQETE